MSILPSDEYNPLDTFVKEDYRDNDETQVAREGAARVDSYGVYPTRTWRLVRGEDDEDGRIVEHIKDEEALEQFAMKALRTARNVFMIYNEQYGTDVFDYIGQDNSRALTLSEVPRLIRETLIYDDRINNVEVTDIRYGAGDKLYVDVKIDTVYGVTELDITF